MSAYVLLVGGFIMLGMANTDLPSSEWRIYNAGAIILFVMSTAVSIESLMKKGSR